MQPLTGIFVHLHDVNSSQSKILDAFVKDLRKSDRISGIVHKKVISKQQIQKLFESGELGPAETKDPAQLQRTAWLYLGLFFGRRGRENQRDVKPGMLALRMTPQGEEYFELNGQFPGAVPAMKNHQGGLSDAENESDAKIFFSVLGLEFLLSTFSGCLFNCFAM